jgi:hypothetical protein
MSATQTTAVKLSTAQRHVLQVLVAAGGSKLVTAELSRVSINKLTSLGFVTVKPGGTTSTCPRSGVDVFTPGPATVTITAEGRLAEQQDRARNADAKGGAR